MRYFIELSYDGSAYCGWQVQSSSCSVQELLESGGFVLKQLLPDVLPVAEELMQVCMHINSLHILTLIKK